MIFSVILHHISKRTDSSKGFQHTTPSPTTTITLASKAIRCMPAAARTLERLCLFLLATSVGCSRAFFSQLQLRSDSSSYSSLCAQFGYNIASTAFIATRAIQTAASHPIAGSSGSCSPASGLQRSFCETSTASAGSTTTMAEAGFSSRSIDQVRGL